MLHASRADRARSYRHGRVHEPGTGARHSRRQADRHLGVRLRAVRDADRARRVCRRDGRRTRSRRFSSASPTGGAAAGDAGSHSTAPAPLPGEGSEAAAEGHRRRQDRDRRHRRAAVARRRRTGVPMRTRLHGSPRVRVASPVGCRGSWPARSRRRLRHWRVEPQTRAAARRHAIHAARLPAGQLLNGSGGAHIVAISPDGTQMAYVGHAVPASISDRCRQLDVKAIPGTESYRGRERAGLLARRSLDRLLRRRRSDAQENGGHGRCGRDDLPGRHPDRHQLGAGRHRLRPGRQGHHAGLAEWRHAGA